MRTVFTLVLSGLLVFIMNQAGTAQNLTWAKITGGTDIDQARAIAVDPSGWVYTTGYFTGTVDFDPGPGTFFLTSSGMQDVYVSKFDSAGNFKWALQLGGSSDEAGYGIAVDSNGYIYVTGRFTGTADFDPGAGTFNLTANLMDCFITKLDALAGNLVWAKQFITSFIVDPYSIAVDMNGNVITTGRFIGTVDFDPGVGSLIFSNPGFHDDAYISKLDSSGNLVWARQLAAPPNGYSYVNSVALDDSGNIYTTGEFSDTIDFDPGVAAHDLIGDFFGDAFIYKLDAAGNFQWAKQLSGSGNDGAVSIALDASGNVYTTGLFNETTDFDPGVSTLNLSAAVAGNHDVYISKLDALGNFVWAKQFESTVGSIIRTSAIAVDESGNVYTAGGFMQSVDFDPGSGIYSLSSTGQSDAFISKLDSAGDFVSALQLGGAGFAFGRGIDLDSVGNIYTTGHFQQTVDFDPGPGIFNLLSAGNDDVFVIKLQSESNTTTSINEDSWDSKINLYPNPTNGSITIESERSFGNAIIAARNILGQEMFRKTCSSTNSISITLDGAAGIYFIELIHEDKHGVFRVVKN